MPTEFFWFSTKTKGKDFYHLELACPVLGDRIMYNMAYPRPKIYIRCAPLSGLPKRLRPCPKCIKRKRSAVPPLDSPTPLGLHDPVDENLDLG